MSVYEGNPAADGIAAAKTENRAIVNMEKNCNKIQADMHHDLLSEIQDKRDAKQSSGKSFNKPKPDKTVRFGF